MKRCEYEPAGYGSDECRHCGRVEALHGDHMSISHDTLSWLVKKEYDAGVHAGVKRERERILTLLREQDRPIPMLHDIDDLVAAIEHEALPERDA